MSKAKEMIETIKVVAVLVTTFLAGVGYWATIAAGLIK